MFLATPPGADQAQLLAILFEHRVIGDPGPLPAAACGLTLAGGMTPQRDQHLHPQASEPLEPGAFGQRPEQTRREIFVPAPHAAQFGVRATAKEGGHIIPDDFAQQLLLAP